MTLRAHLQEQLEAFLDFSSRQERFIRFLETCLKKERSQQGLDPELLRPEELADFYHRKRDEIVQQASEFYPLPSLSPAFSRYLHRSQIPFFREEDNSFVDSFTYQVEFSMEASGNVTPFALRCIHPENIYDRFIKVLESVYEVDAHTTSEDIKTNLTNEMEHFIRLFVLLDAIRLSAGSKAIFFFQSQSITPDHIGSSLAPYAFNHALEQMPEEKLQSLKRLIVDIQAYGSLAEPINYHSILFIHHFNTLSEQNAYDGFTIDELTQSLGRKKQIILSIMDKLNQVVEYLPKLKSDKDFKKAQSQFEKLFSIKSYLLNEEEKQSLIKQLERLRVTLKTAYLEFYATLGREVDLLKSKIESTRGNALLRDGYDRESIRVEVREQSSQIVMQGLEGADISREYFNTLSQEAQTALLALSSRKLKQAAVIEQPALNVTLPTLSFQADPIRKHQIKKRVQGWLIGIGVALTLISVAAISLATFGVAGAVGLGALTSLSGWIAAGVSGVCGLLTVGASTVKYQKEARCEKIMRNIFDSDRQRELQLEQAPRQAQAEQQQEGVVVSQARAVVIARDQQGNLAAAESKESDFESKADRQEVKAASREAVTPKNHDLLLESLRVNHESLGMVTASENSENKSTGGRVSSSFIPNVVSPTRRALERRSALSPRSHGSAPA